MRDLTIRRDKSFVACLMPDNVYVEDAAYGKTKINKVPCTKIAKLKNGKEVTFQIPEEPTRIFVTVDNLSRNYCNDMYEIPMGNYDLLLTGKHRYNPFNGNAFRFDGEVTEAMKKHRKKNNRRAIPIYIIAFVIGILIGFFGANSAFDDITAEPAAFSNSGMTITLTDSFTERQYDEYTFCYDSLDVAVFGLKEEFSLVEGFEDYTLDEYANAVIENNGFESVELKKDNGLTYFEYDYTNTQTATTYEYYAFVYKTADSFWTIQFAVDEDSAADYQQSIIDWAKSVKFEC